MKKYILPLIFLFAHNVAFAQPANDDCVNATYLGTLGAPGTCGTGIQTGTGTSGSDNSFGATPENPYTTLNGCGMASPANSVWYSFTVPTRGYGIEINISNAAFTPNIALWHGNNCNQLSGVQCNVGNAGGNVTLDVPSGIIPGDTYYLQVSGNTGESGAFDYSINSYQDCSNCLIGSSIDVNPLPTNGSYDPGTVVDFCFKIDQWQQVSNNWLHGVEISNIGGGWDPSTITITGTPGTYLEANGCGQWGFYPTGIPGNNVPGWYYDGGSNVAGNCISLDGDPSNNFGDGEGCSGCDYSPGINDWEFCFSIQVDDNCNPGADLSITLNPTADGETGSWSSVGCTGDATTTFNATAACCPPNMTSTPSCSNTDNGTATATPVGAAGPYDYVWEDAGNNVVSSSTGVAGANTATGLAPGTYTVTVTDANLCASTATVVVGTRPSPTADAGNNVTTCEDVNGNTVPVGIGGSPTASGGSGAGYTYVWDNATSLNNSTIANPTASPTANTTYTVTVTDGAGCTATSTVDVTINNISAPTMNATAETCDGLDDGSITATPVNGTPNFNYSWNTTPVQTTQTATGLAPGNYTVTLIDDDGCASTASATVNPGTVVNAGFNQPAAQCLTGNSFNFTNTGTTGVTYNWNFGDAGTSTNEDPSHTYGTDGTFTVTQIVSSGVCADTTSLTVTVNPMPVPVATSDSVACNGGSNGSVTVSNITNSPSAFPGGYGYSWNTTPGQNTQTATGLGAGSYTVTVQDLTTTCTGQVTIDIFEPAPLTATETHNDVVCVGGSDGDATANPAGGTPAYSYSWNTTPVQTTQTATGLAAGTYTCTITDENNCTTTVDVTILDGTTITAAFNLPADQCLTGNNFTFTNTGTTGATYSWDFGDTGTSTAESPSHSYTNPGTYTVTQIVSAGTCADTISQDVTVDPMPVIHTSAVDVLCFGDATGSVQVDSVTNSGGPFGYQWDAAAGNATTFNATGLTAGNYTVTVTDQTTNCATQATVTVNQPAAALSATETHNDPVCNGDTTGNATANPTGGTAPYSFSWNTTPVQTTQTATGLAAGTYTCTITDTNGCITTVDAILVDPAGIVLSTSQAQANCGQPDGSATVGVVSGGSGTFSYLWDAAAGNQATATATNLLAGTYNVTVTDDVTGCTKDTSVTVNSTTGINVTANFIQDALCNGSADGQAYVTVSGGTTPYTYSWNSTPVQTDDTLTAGAGNYIVTVTDSNGCTGNDAVVIGEPTPVVASITTSQDVSCFGLTDGSATADGAGGTGGTYTYSWNTTPVQNTQTATNLDNGTYTVTVTDSNSCADTVQVVIQDGIVVTASFDVPAPQCLTGNSFNFNNTGTTGGGTTYEWDFGDATGTSNQENPAYTYADSGSYNVTQIVYSGVCSDTITQAITVYPMPVPTLASDSVNCAGGSDGSVSVNNITNSPGTFPGDYGFSWNTIPVQNTQTATGLGVGNYTVTVTDNTTNCQVTQNIDIFEPTQVIATITGSTDETCTGAENGTATVAGSQGTGGYTYSWNTVPVQTTATATGLAPGTYTAYVYDDNMCVDSTTVVINAGPQLTSTITATNVTCAGLSNGTIDFTVNGAPGAVTYAWTPSGSTSEDPIGLTAGWHYVTATSGGCQAVDSIEITEPLPLVVTVDSTFDVLCNGGSDGSAYASAAGGTTPYAYSWNTAPVTNADNITNQPTGNYTVTVTDSNNCTATANTFIDQPAPLDANTGSVNAYCNLNTGTVWIEAQSGTPPYTYVWDSLGTVMGNADTLSNLYPGDYQITLTDSNNCIFTDVITVASDPPGTVSIASQNNVNCNGGNDGDVTVQVNNAFPPYTYQWDDGANQTTNPATNLSSGVYNVLVTDSLGCVMTTNVSITEPFPLTLNLAVTNPTCTDTCDAIIDATPGGGNGPYTFDWNDPANQTTQTASGLCEGTYYLTIEDDNGCQLTDSAKVIDPLKMELASTIIPANCNQADGSAYVNVTANGNAPFVYQWSDGVNIIDNDSLLDNVVAGTYYALVEDLFSCIVIDTVTIPNLSGPVIDSLTQTNVLCFGNNTGEAEVYVSGGEFPYTYQWNDGANQTTPNATNLIAGGYTVTVTDSNGCTVSAPVNITEPDELVLTSGGVNPTCTGYNDGLVWVDANGGVTPYDYLWNSTPNQVTDTAFNLNVIGGGYTVTVTDSNGCIETANVILVDPPLFTINLTKTDVSCNGGSNGTATVVENNGIAPFNYNWDDALNQSTQTATGLSANTYNVVVTDSSGCIANGQIIIDEPLPLTITQDTVGHVSCNGFTDGFIGVTANGGSGTYSYSWELNGNVVSTNQNPNGLGAGQYTLTVTDTAGCNEQLVVDVNEPDPLDVSVTAEDAECFGDNSGYAYATVSGGTMPYYYQWNDLALQQTDTAFNLIAGNYDLTVTDTNGCIFNVSNIIVDEPDQIALSTTTISSSCGADNGSATVTVGGGTAPYNYQWNDPASQSNAVATGLFAGSYTVYITDFNGCVDSTTANVTDQGSPTVTIPDATDVSCNGAADGTATAEVTGGVMPYSYLWTNGDTSLTATGLSGQTYSITVTDSNGCIASESITIQEASGLSVAVIDSVDVSCFGGNNGEATAFANGGNGTNYTYSWNTVPAQNTANATGLAQGTYVISVADSNNCMAYDTVTIEEPTLLTVTLDSLKHVECFGESNGYINVIANGGTQPYTTYAWTPNVSNGSSATGLAQGTYDLTITDNNGCTVSDSYIINQPDSMTISLTSTPSTCGQFNGSAEVTNVTGGTAPYSYNWNDPSNQTNALAAGLSANTYMATITDENGCTVSDTVSVIDLPGPVVDSVITVNPTCNGDNNGSAEVFVSGNNPISYAWTPGGQTTSVASGLSAGVYSVLITDANSCQVNQGGIVLTDPTAVTANITLPATACYGQEIQLFGVGGGGTPFSAPQDAYDIIWLAPFNTTGSGPYLDTVYSNFTYNIVVQDANGCVASASESITVGQPLNINAVGDEICQGDTAFVQASASGGMFGATYEYTWLEYDSLTGASLNPIGVSNPTSTNSTNLYPAQSTDYIVYVSDGCSQNDTAGFVVTVNDSALVSVTTTPSGCPEPFWGIGFEVQNDVWNSTFSWDFDGDGVYDQTTTNDSIGHNYTISGIYDINLMVETENGCISTFSYPQEVEIYTIPIADFEPVPDVTTEIDPTFNFDDLSTPDVQEWYWNFGDGNTNLIDQNPIHTYADTGWYPVELIVYNRQCYDTIVKLVQVKPDFLFLIPNTFTPQGDNINDVFMPGTMIGVSEEDYNFYIFDRWGEKIWEGHDINDGWDGTAKGGSEIVQTETYVYLIKLKGTDGLIREYRGHVNVLK